MFYNRKYHEEDMDNNKSDDASINTRLAKRSCSSGRISLAKRKQTVDRHACFKCYSYIPYLRAGERLEPAKLKTVREVLGKQTYKGERYNGHQMLYRFGNVCGFVL